ncbi:hypothetical protein LAZ40_02410 [Cereibacter sphaeroides]|uniref:hypothetical protein n=1 Tax=Cereibacter sphaeroides TaxID=1063 RepID=UPI001F1DA9C3|nr:hypothetical protein [Cereibacter sphaeroides]MCE6957911.1 hypothetical protein [Cereibacter sphaeroides]MCE6971741.1 hypothetical protein [Cereibacter sphaeroides]
MIEIWGQDSATKGCRLIRFERITSGRHKGWLRWLGPVGGPEDDKHVYGEQELLQNRWQFVENEEEPAVKPGLDAGLEP